MSYKVLHTPDPASPFVCPRYKGVSDNFLSCKNNTKLYGKSVTPLFLPSGNQLWISLLVIWDWVMVYPVSSCPGVFGFKKKEC